MLSRNHFSHKKTSEGNRIIGSAAMRSSLKASMLRSSFAPPLRDGSYSVTRRALFITPRPIQELFSLLLSPPNIASMTTFIQVNLYVAAEPLPRLIPP